MADGNEQFQIGVVHGLADEPLYQWQDPTHQEMYDAGYLIGQGQRIRERGWDTFEARMKRRGLVRDR